MPDGQAVETNPTETVATSGDAGQASVSPGTLEGQSGQVSTQGQSTPTEESFSNVDPKTLPPEMQAIYKNLQADYTKKTQNLSETRKKAEAFDQVRSRADFNEWWGGATRAQKADFKEQKQEAEKRLGEKISDEDFTKAFQSKDDFLNLLERVVNDRSEKSQKKIADLEQKLSIKDAQDIVDQFATQQDKEGKPLRPDFYKMDEDQLITGYLRLNVPDKGYSQEQYAEKLNEAYGWAKATTQKYYEMGKAEALKVIQTKVNTSSNPPTGAAKGAYSGPDPKKLTPSEAFQLAKKGIRVPQES